MTQTGENMGRIFYLMGKSASGKDTLFKKILKENPELKTVVLYTTRPMREGERDGVEYHFCSEEQLREFERQRKVIESRTYQTVLGPWSYATVDDGQIDLKNSSYLVIGTLESYGKMREYFGSDVMVPLYIDVDDGVRLTRALARERRQKEPNYAELCRRFLADDADFSKKNLEQWGISRYFDNQSLEECLREINQVIFLYR